MTMPSNDEMREALKGVIDPELGYNIVDLGMIYDVEIIDGNVVVTMTLTTPGCPASEMIQGGVTECLAMMEGIRSVTVNLVWEPAWGPELMSPEAKEHFGVNA